MLYLIEDRDYLKIGYTNNTEHLISYSEEIDFLYKIREW